jgi:predicted methyltransferase
VRTDYAIELATRAGFVLDGESEVNANPRDTKDHPNGVWSLPPSFRGGDADRAKFAAIGESDRFTLRFRKPAAHH